MTQKNKKKETGGNKQIDTLKKHFPQCFDKYGKFIPKKLNEIVQASDTEFSKESYSLNWLGKSYARLLANENPLTLLSEDKAHNEKPENINSENLLIKGDNLEVLKHLQGAYSESIKMIYIDPPYNTGSDGFVYQDDRKFTVDELSKLAGIDKDEAKRVLDFTQSKANSHSAWLTFMYPRLYVARELLRDDGVIFISIDDSEVAQLKVLCDEVFGEASFISSFLWKSRQTTDSRKSTRVSTDHEYIICYAKSVNQFSLRGNEIDKSKYKNPDDDSRGCWASIDLSVQATKDQRPNQFYDIVNPETGAAYPANPQRVWSKSKAVTDVMIKEGRIIFPVNLDGRPREKKFIADLKTGFTGFSSWLDSKKAGYTTNGTRDFSALIEERVFQFPKPVRLIKNLVEQVISDESIILDFFAGSGTTAHSVFELNRQDGVRRNWVSVQLPERTSVKGEAFKAGYKTIFDITKARIEKAAKKIKTEQPDYKGDLGFKVFETKPLFGGYSEKLEKLEGKQTKLFDGAALNEAQLEQLLTTWKVYDGMPLTKSLKQVKLGKYTAYQHDKVLYLMNKGFRTDGITDFFKKLDSTKGKDKDFEVEKLVLFGHNFESKHLKEIQDAVNQYKNRKQKVVSVVVRH